ncbi:hypothetical protein CAOG_02305, partial [Capsaspora owczarzaki ATCC 30864]|uniref:Uncharacterized protein n=1 Tax=Capsaspora owczarzaki (strain ATCC 30864) TaxID=595528 RepID=A0A0D2U7R3_CAPO3
MTDTSDAAARIQRLRTELDEVNSILRAKESDLILSAQLGQALLESNNQLTAQHDQAVSELSSRIAGLENANHQLQVQLEASSRGLANARRDLDRESVVAREELETERQELQQRERRQAQVVQDLTTQLELAQADTEEQRAAFAKLQAAHEQQGLALIRTESAVRNAELARKRMRSKWLRLATDPTRDSEQSPPSARGSASKDAADADAEDQVHDENNNNENEPDDDADDFAIQRVYELEEALLKTKVLSEERQSRIQSLETTVATQLSESKHLKAKIGGLMGAAQEHEAQIISLTNTIESQRQRVEDLELECSLEADRRAGKMQTGRSVFSDVEDRRAELERQLASTTSTLRQLAKSFDLARLQNQKLNAQLNNMLQMQGSKADQAKMTRLEQDNAQLQSETRQLCLQIELLEDDKKHIQSQLVKARAVMGTGSSSASSGSKSSSSSGRVIGEFGAGGLSAEHSAYIEYLETEAETARAALATSKKELRTRQMLQLNDINRVRDLETQSYRQATQIEELRKENVQLKIKLDETLLMQQVESSTNGIEPQQSQQSQQPQQSQQLQQPQSRPHEALPSKEAADTQAPSPPTVQSKTCPIPDLESENLNAPQLVQASNPPNATAKKSIARAEEPSARVINIKQANVQTEPACVQQ